MITEEQVVAEILSACPSFLAVWGMPGLVSMGLASLVRIRYVGEDEPRIMVLYMSGFLVLLDR